MLVILVLRLHIVLGQRRDPGSDLGGELFHDVGVLFSEVVGLGWIGGEVVEFEFAVFFAGGEAELPLTITNERLAAGGAGFPEQWLAPDVGSFSEPCGGSVFAIEFGEINLHSGEGADCGQEIGATEHGLLIHPACGNDSGPAHDPRAANTTFPVRVLATAMRAVEAHLIEAESALGGFGHVGTLIGAKDDESVFTQAQFVEAFEEHADIVIEGLDIGEVAAHGIIHIATGFAHVGELRLHLRREVAVVDFEAAPTFHKAVDGVHGVVRDVTPDVDIKRAVFVLLDELDGIVIDMRVASASIGGLLFLSALALAAFACPR